MRSTSLALLAALALGAPIANAQQLRGALPPPAAQQQPAIVPLDGADRTLALRRANETLNTFTRLQGRFEQVTARGRSTGQFYLERPGKLRFEYDPPSRMLIVCDGRTVALRDPSLHNTQRTPLRATPLNLVLRQGVDLARDARITQVGRAGDWIVITARDKSGSTSGRITLFFSGGGTQLSSWDIIDAAGRHTRINLSGVSAPASIDPAMFRLPDRAG